jgi:hypothetical protein
MNEKHPSNSLISKSRSGNISLNGPAIAGNSSPTIEDAETSSQSTYGSFKWFFSYAKMFMTRLGKDLIQSAMWYFYSDEVLPEHIIHLMHVQLDLYQEREIQSASYSRYNVIKRFSNTEHSTQTLSLVAEKAINLPPFHRV